MAERDPNKPQLDFPQLVADIITELRLTGQVGLLDFLDKIRPVYIVAARGGALNVVASAPVFTSASRTGGASISPAVNAIIADTGPLPAGDYDIFAMLTVQGVMNVIGSVQLQHRNAADAATIGTLMNIGMTVTHQANTIALPLIGYTLGLNERLRVQVALGTVTGQVGTTIGFRLRPTP